MTKTMDEILTKYNEAEALIKEAQQDKTDAEFEMKERIIKDGLLDLLKIDVARVRREYTPISKHNRKAYKV